MFPKNEKNREWTALMDRYISLHKYMKEVGKVCIAQSRSGRVNADVQVKLADSLVQADKVLSHLKDFFKPCLNTDLFVEDKLKIQVRNLIEENTKLRHGSEHLQRVAEREQHTTNQVQSLQDENRHMRQIILKLEQRCEVLGKALQTMPPLVSEESHSGENWQTIYKRKEAQFDETLKIQNELIEELKQQLNHSNRDKQLFRSLNLNLEAELNKTQEAESKVNLHKELLNELQLEDATEFIKKSHAAEQKTNLYELSNEPQIENEAELMKQNYETEQNVNFYKEAELQKEPQLEQVHSNQHNYLIYDRELEELLKGFKADPQLSQSYSGKDIRDLQSTPEDSKEAKKSALGEQVFQEEDMEKGDSKNGQYAFKYDYSELQQQLRELRLQNELQEHNTEPSFALPTPSDQDTKTSYENMSTLSLNDDLK